MEYELHVFLKKYGYSAGKNQSCIYSGILRCQNDEYYKCTFKGVVLNCIKQIIFLENAQFNN